MSLANAPKSEQRSSIPIDTVIADDHAVVRSGLRALLDAIPLGSQRRFHIVAEAENGIQAVAAVKPVSYTHLTLPTIYSV